MPSEAEMHANNLFRLEKMNKRNKKMLHKRAKEGILDTPPSMYNMNHLENHAHESVPHQYGNDERYIVTSNGVAYQPYYEPVYVDPRYGQNYYIQHYRKLPKDKNVQYYAPFYGMPKVGTCPGCGGKTSLTPAKVQNDHMHQANHDYDNDFLDKISPSAFTPLRSKHNSESKHSSVGELGYPNFLSPAQALKKNDIPNLDKSKNLLISDTKQLPFRHTPTPKKEMEYCASDAKIFKELPMVGEMNSQLFSQDLGDEENNKSPFSFLKKQNSSHMIRGERGTREAFNNITNTINKSPFFEDKQLTSKVPENFAPKLLKFEHKH
jgi:hypothetical protein